MWLTEEDLVNLTPPRLGQMNVIVVDGVSTQPLGLSAADVL
jgi:hypothetical protein